MVKKRPCTIYLYMEGGGDKSELHTRFRQGMISILEKCGLKGMMPKVFSCGSRNDAYRDFKQAIKEEKNAVLLVDSESAVCDEFENLPWHHLKTRDKWDKPENAANDQCHLMVQCMESWFLADVETLKEYYGQGFNENHFPRLGQDVESIDKDQVANKLKNATRNCRKKGEYHKGNHSFDILGKINPQKVKAASKWAARFFDTLKEKCDN
jgi:hypothetical protein